MPSEEPEEFKYVLGGCTIPEDMQDYRCINCSTDYYEGNDKFRIRSIFDDSGKVSFAKNARKAFPFYVKYIGNNVKSDFLQMPEFLVASKNSKVPRRVIS